MLIDQLYKQVPILSFDIFFENCKQWVAECLGPGKQRLGTLMF